MLNEKWQEGAFGSQGDEMMMSERERERERGGGGRARKTSEEMNRCRSKTKKMSMMMRAQNDKLRMEEKVKTGKLNQKMRVMMMTRLA
jgi:hypothetical protein